MLKTAAIAICPKHLGKVAGGLLLLAALTFLVGCQGVSAAGSSGQQQSTTLSLLTATADFGSVAVGSSKTLTVTATNSGPASVTVSGAAISTKYFSLVAPSLPVTVAAGQSTVIGIKFTPNAAGAFNATLSITSDSRHHRVPPLQKTQGCCSLRRGTSWSNEKQRWASPPLPCRARNARCSINIQVFTRIKG